jgi:hypothetical protein
MGHDVVALATLVVIVHSLLLYWAVFCPNEAPMKRLVMWTKAVSGIAVAVIVLLLRK